MDVLARELAASMRAAWGNFAANGNPSTRTVRWPPFQHGGQGLTFVTLQPKRDTDFALRHHGGFWAPG